MSSPARVTPARLLLSSAAPVRGTVVGAFLALTVTLAADLAGPLLIRGYVDRVTGGTTAGELVLYGVGYLGIAVVGVLAGLPTSYLSANAGWGIADTVRRRVLTHVVTRWPVLEIESRSRGELLESIEGNADIVGRSIALAGFRVVGNVALAIGTLVVMFLVVPPAATAILVLVVVVAYALNKLTRASVRRWEVARNEKARIFGFTGDALAARDDLVPLGRSGWAVRRFTGMLAGLLGLERRAYVGGRAFWPLTQVFFAVSFALGFGVGLNLLGQNQLSIGTLAMVYLYVDRLRGPLEDMSSQVDQVQRLLAALSVTAGLLNGTDDGTTGSPRRQLPAGPLPVEFTDVTFGYGDTPVLRGVSFSVPPGGALGIVGRTGAGKSTILNLLCGLARPDSGRVRIGGVDPASLHPEELAERISVLSQRAHLFSASVRDNVTFFDPTVPDAAVWATLDELGAGRWVRELPDGLDTLVGAGGRTLSEGEAQLLAGARVMLRRVDLVLVDEGTSRLDPVTERSWSELLERIGRDRTVVVVAHRHHTLARFGDVVVVDEGRIRQRVSGADVARLADTLEAMS